MDGVQWIKRIKDIKIKSDKDKEDEIPKGLINEAKEEN